MGETFEVDIFIPKDERSWVEEGSIEKVYPYDKNRYMVCVSYTHDLNIHAHDSDIQLHSRFNAHSHTYILESEY